MNREDYLKALIKQKGLTVKGFAQQINMPYSTLLSMLNGSIGGAAVDNVIKICKGLGISVNDLQEHVKEGSLIRMDVSEHEKMLLLRYRERTELHAAIDKLLDL